MTGLGSRLLNGHVDLRLGRDRQRKRLHFQRMPVQFEVRRPRVLEVPTVGGHGTGTDGRLVTLAVRFGLAGHLVAERHLIGQFERLAQGEDDVGRLFLKSNERFKRSISVWLIFTGEEAWNT